MTGNDTAPRPKIGRGASSLHIPYCNFKKNTAKTQTSDRKTVLKIEIFKKNPDFY